MSIVRRIGPGSAFKVGMVVYAVFGFVVAVFMFMVARMVPLANQPNQPALLNMVFFGPTAIIVLPLVYGLMGGILGAIGALIYNLASRWVGGLQVDIN